MPNLAQDTLRLTYLVLLALVVFLGLVDFGMWWRGAPTLTDFLRLHPAYFWTPALSLLAGLILLYLHLFVYTEWP